jgi:uncharacterized protein YggT (Ycf19 family)
MVIAVPHSFGTQQETLRISRGLPVFAPARQIIPPLGGLDISPMLVMVALQAIRSVLVRKHPP